MKLFRKLRNKYSNAKIQTKLTLSYLIIITIPMAALIVFFWMKLYGMIVADTISSEQQSASQTVPHITAEVDKIIDASDGIIGEQFYRDLVNPRRTASFSELAASAEAAQFEDKVDSYIGNDTITNVRMYMDIDRSEALFSDGRTKDLFLPMTQAQGTYWHGIFQGESSLNYLFCPTFYLSPNELDSYGDMAYITKFNIMYDGNYTSCYLAVYFSRNALEDTLKRTLSSSSNVAYLLSDRNNTVAASDNTLAALYHLNYEEVESSFMSSNNFIPRKVAGAEVYTGFYSIPKTGWYMVICVPSEPLYDRSNAIVALFIFIYIVCIAIAFWLAHRLSRSLTRRLGSVADEMSKAKTSLPVALPPSTINDEIGDVIDSYNYMTEMIHNLMDEQQEQADDLRTAEFNSLQAQINPHFLYNTMDMISWLSQQGNTRAVTRAVQKLSRYYKLTLSRRKSLSTIENELEHARIYIDLQNMRYNDQIDFVADIPDNLMEYTIPKLTFQPLVENALIHGIFEKPSKQGTVLITGWMEGEDIVILISDDGVGMSPEQLKTVLTSESSSGTKGTNIAVYNTNRRIQILYGQQYGLTYDSAPGEGTEVTMRIPARYDEE